MNILGEDEIVTFCSPPFPPFFTFPLPFTFSIILSALSGDHYVWPDIFRTLILVWLLFLNIFFFFQIWALKWHWPIMTLFSFFEIDVFYIPFLYLTFAISLWHWSFFLGSRPVIGLIFVVVLVFRSLDLTTLCDIDFILNFSEPFTPMWLFLRTLTFFIFFLNVP